MAKYILVVRYEGDAFDTHDANIETTVKDKLSNMDPNTKIGRIPSYDPTSSTFELEVADYVPKDFLATMNLGDGVSFEVTKV